MDEHCIIYDIGTKMAIEDTNFITEKLQISENDFEYTSEIFYNSICYKSGHYMTRTSCGGSTEIYRILDAVIVSKVKVFLFCYKVTSLYQDHYLSYEVLSSINDTKLILPINAFDGPPLNAQKLPNGKVMIGPKIYFSKDIYSTS